MKPDPLGIAAAKQKASDDYALIWKYYGDQYGYESSTSDYAFRRYIINNVVVSDWHRTNEECHAEVADKIRAWEKENPELAIKDAEQCTKQS